MSDRGPRSPGGWIAYGMSCPLAGWREHCFIRSLMVLPHAAGPYPETQMGERNCCSLETIGRRIMCATRRFEPSGGERPSRLVVAAAG